MSAADRRAPRPGKWLRASAPVALLLLAALAGHGVRDRAAAGTPERVPTAADATAAARLPQLDGPFSPALTRIAPPDPGRAGHPGPALDGAELTDTDTCEGCHADVAAQWLGSAHAAASFNNPIYRSSVDRFRKTAGRRASRMCAGCHDPALLVDGAMDSRVSPEDPRAHAGIGCRLCHGVQSVRPEGNGSYTLRARGPRLPRRDDPASLTRHRADVSLRALGSELCVTCHRSFVGPETDNPHHLSGMDDAGAWLASGYAGATSARVDAVARRSCIDCHMPPEPASESEASRDDEGRVASHRFLGGHTYLAAMAGHTGNLDRTRARLRGVASVDIAALRAGDGDSLLLPLGSDGALARLQPFGTALELQVVVRNLHVGHRLPGGVLDAQDTWLQVEALDRDGRVLARSEGDDAHRLRALAIGRDGVARLRREVGELAAIVSNTTLAPRDATLVRYRLTLPTAPAAPSPTAAAPPRDGVLLRARLMHRSRNGALQAAACAATRTGRGRRFTKASVALQLPVLDACVPQPVTLIAEDRLWLGAGDRRDGPGHPPAWRRLYEHGLALGHGPVETLGDARRSLHAALRTLPDDATLSPMGAARARASVHAELARLASRQGLPEQAQHWLSRARRDLPAHPALDHIGADAWLRVWQFERALPELDRLTGALPLDPRALAAHAGALSALGRDPQVLPLTARALALLPMDAGLLRLQALALGATGDDRTESALDAYDRVQHGQDAQQQLKRRCITDSPLCEHAPHPLHTHLMH